MNKGDTQFYPQQQENGQREEHTLPLKRNTNNPQRHAN